ncbi:MAG: DUF192 domain-containing protein [Bacilli bacterium]|nr:DUF192 domain-containing protein [Bacilli bacterium]
MKIVICNSFLKRLIGFIGKKDADYGLCFPKCNSIHTFFMRKNIDVIMTDKNNLILYVFNDLKPNRIIFPKKNVYYTYEFPFRTNYKINNYIKKEEV